MSSSVHSPTLLDSRTLLAQQPNKTVAPRRLLTARRHCLRTRTSRVHLQVTIKKASQCPFQGKKKVKKKRPLSRMTPARQRNGATIVASLPHFRTTSLKLRSGPSAFRSTLVGNATGIATAFPRDRLQRAYWPTAAAADNIHACISLARAATSISSDNLMINTLQLENPAYLEST